MTRSSTSLFLLTSSTPQAGSARPPQSQSILLYRPSWWQLGNVAGHTAQGVGGEVDGRRTLSTCRDAAGCQHDVTSYCKPVAILTTHP